LEAAVMLRTSTIRRLGGWAMLGVLLVSIAIWRFSDDALPDVIRISTSLSSPAMRVSMQPS